MTGWPNTFRRSTRFFLVIWARYVAQTVLMTALFVPRMRQRVFRTLRPWPQLLRGLSLVSVSLLFINGLHFIPLAEATAVIFLTPVLVTVASALLGERINPSQWIAVGFGLLGVLIIVRPGSALFTPAALLPLGAALSFTVYQLITRRLAGTDHPVTSNYLTSLVGCVALSVLVIFNWYITTTLECRETPRGPAKSRRSYAKRRCFACQRTACGAGVQVRGQRVSTGQPARRRGSTSQPIDGASAGLGRHNA